MHPYWQEEIVLDKSRLQAKDRFSNHFCYIFAMWINRYNYFRHANVYDESSIHKASGNIPWKNIDVAPGASEICHV